MAGVSLTITPELDGILREVASEMSMDLSRLVETLLRESPAVQERVARRRAPPTQTKRGRDPAELWLLARVAAKQWEAGVQSGQIVPPREAKP